MKVTYTFDSEDMHDMELLRRHHVADKMADLLFRLVNNRTGMISEKASKTIRDECDCEGICFEEIYT